MNSKERVAVTLRGRIPDRVPIRKYPMPSPDDYDYDAITSACEAYGGYSINTHVAFEVMNWTSRFTLLSRCIERWQCPTAYTQADGNHDHPAHPHPPARLPGELKRPPVCCRFPGRTA